ncbi:MAG: CHAD domain-containing protein, partial [Chloroflexi bacterium]|nr:CHAD domain-containing protein [Chloroflexota bacterium]
MASECETLTPGMRADEAAKCILRRQLQIIRANESYIAQDVNPEHLHKFRVAVRRSRSALTQIKGVFPAGITARFKRDLALVGQMTNELRDLDVFLLDEPHCRAMLPENLAADIGPLFACLREKRTAALADAIAFLDSPRYRRIMADWETFLNKPVPQNPAAPRAARPIVKIARKRIHKRYRRIAAEGTEILENAADEKLHALRIECKKLRRYDATIGD